MMVDDVLDLVDSREILGRVGDTRVRVKCPSTDEAPQRGDRVPVHAKKAVTWIRDGGQPVDGARRACTSDAVVDAFDSAFARAMSATVNRAGRFDAMADDLALAMRADRRHGVYGAFEAVERQGLPRLRDLKGLVVVVSADVTRRHLKHPF